jgi:hypothetical protein
MTTLVIHYFLVYKPFFKISFYDVTIGVSSYFVVLPNVKFGIEVNYSVICGQGGH